MKTAQLIELVTNIRHELGVAPGFSQSVSTIPAVKYLCGRVQEELYESFAWPHLIIEDDETLQAGQRYYSFDGRLNRNRIIGAFVKWSSSWIPVDNGFDPLIYNGSIPEDTYRSDPVQRWRFWEGDQYEVWPAPASEQVLRWRFVRNLNPLIADADVCDIDANLITMFVAAELLAKMKSADAGAKAQAAQQHLSRIKAQMMPNQVFCYGGSMPDSRQMEMKTRKV